MRIVIRDSSHTLSFTADRDVVPALVAACAAEPRTVEALLLESEAYYPGLSDRVMGELMRFDLWMQGHATKVRLIRPEPGQDHVLPAAFEVVDPLTRRLAYIPDAEGLVQIDLEMHEIAPLAGNAVVPARWGVVQRHAPLEVEETETVYALGPAWSISTLADAGVGHG